MPARGGGEINELDGKTKGEWNVSHPNVATHLLLAASLLGSLLGWDICYGLIALLHMAKTVIEQLGMCSVLSLGVPST